MSANEFEPISFYVDLDSLFDTRLSTLFLISPETAEKALKSGYYARSYDEFEGLSVEDYQKAYQARNLNTIRQGAVTCIVSVIRDFVKETITALLNSPLRRQAKIVVNTYPYQLTDEQAQNIIHGLAILTNKMADIEVIHMTLEELTPAYVKANFIQMAMYQYWDWLEVHSVNRNWVDTQCHHVTLYGPQLVKSKQAFDALKHKPNVFNDIESYTSLFIQLVLLPVHYFSADLRLYGKKTA